MNWGEGRIEEKKRKKEKAKRKKEKGKRKKMNKKWDQANITQAHIKFCAGVLSVWRPIFINDYIAPYPGLQLLSQTQFIKT